MPVSDPKINVLEGGWYLVYSNGFVLTMNEVKSWRDVPNKTDITIMGLKCRNKQYEIKDKTWVPPGKTEMREISISSGQDEIRVTTEPEVGWFIGFYDQENLCKVITRASRVTGKFLQEQVPYA
jgi:hypothetical protein